MAQGDPALLAGCTLPRVPLPDRSVSGLMRMCNGRYAVMHGLLARSLMRLTVIKEFVGQMELDIAEHVH